MHNESNMWDAWLKKRCRNSNRIENGRQYFVVGEKGWLRYGRINASWKSRIRKKCSRNGKKNEHTLAQVRVCLCYSHCVMLWLMRWDESPVEGDGNGIGCMACIYTCMRCLLVLFASLIKYVCILPYAEHPAQDPNSHTHAHTALCTWCGFCHAITLYVCTS